MKALSFTKICKTALNPEKVHKLNFLSFARKKMKISCFPFRVKLGNTNALDSRVTRVNLDLQAVLTPR